MAQKDYAELSWLSGYAVRMIGCVKVNKKEFGKKSCFAQVCAISLAKGYDKSLAQIKWLCQTNVIAQSEYNK